MIDATTVPLKMEHDATSVTAHAHAHPNSPIRAEAAATTDTGTGENVAVVQLGSPFDSDEASSGPPAVVQKWVLDPRYAVGTAHVDGPSHRWEAVSGARWWPSW